MADKIGEENLFESKKKEDPPDKRETIEDAEETKKSEG